MSGVNIELIEKLIHEGWSYLKYGLSNVTTLAETKEQKTEREKEKHVQLQKIDTWTREVQDTLKQLMSGESVLAEAVAVARKRDSEDLPVQEIINILERARQHILSRDIDERIRLLVQDRTLRSTCERR